MGAFLAEFGLPTSEIWGDSTDFKAESPQLLAVDVISIPISFLFEDGPLSKRKLSALKFMSFLTLFF